MFNKSSKTNKRSRVADKLIIGLEYLGRKIRSIRVKLFLLMSILVIVPLVIVVSINHYYYLVNMIDSQVADMQTTAAMMAGEFSEYETLSEAQKDGIYSQMQRYSALNSMRIRVVNENFVIASDSYLIENGKIVINSRVIKAYTSGKGLSDYNSKTGTLEAVTPIYNSERVIMGVLVVDMDISELTSFVDSVRSHESTVIISIIVFLVAVLFLLTINLGRNIKNAYKVVEDVANGHTEKRIETKGSIEVRTFAKNFNMIMDKASAVDESRQEFVSNVSHELKTPITSIKVLADSLNMQEDVPV